MRQRLWRHVLILKRLLVQSSSSTAVQTSSTQSIAVARTSYRSAFEDLQSGEGFPPWLLSGFAYSRHFAVARPNRSGKAASKANPEEPDEKPEPDKKGPRVNRAVTDRFIRVVNEEGHQVMTRQAALELAVRSGLDLVEVDSRSNPVVCKLMDYKKEKYIEKRKEQERRKQQVDKRRLNDLKEVRFGTKIEEKDLEMKAENASRLLQRGHKVKCVVQLQGPVPQDGTVDPKLPELLHKMTNMLQHVSKVEAEPRLASHRAWVMLKPVPPSLTIVSNASNSHTQSATVVSRSEAS